jgi:hypothetical protein
MDVGMALGVVLTYKSLEILDDRSSKFPNHVMGVKGWHDRLFFSERDDAAKTFDGFGVLRISGLT